MKKYEITEEQILDLANGKAKSKLKTMFPDVFDKKELEVGKWYTYKSSNTNWLFNFQGNIHKGNYGFNTSNSWGNDFVMRAFKFTPATDEEVKQALEKECINRFGEDWQNAKIEKCLRNSIFHNIGEAHIEFNLNNTEIWNHNGLIFKDGEWAEPLKQLELTMQEIADKFDVKVENLKIKK